MTELSRRLYRTMYLIRVCEEHLARCHARGLIHGACHTYVGQEAVAAGVCVHLRPDDTIFSTHRGHGHALAKGVSPYELIAELFGRATGVSRGRGGSMHLFAPEIGLVGTSGIVGPSILQAAGAGCSFKLLNTDQVAVAFLGDGAVNNGAFHQGLNMASIWKLPVLFVCENNEFTTAVPFLYAAGNPNVASRAAAYGIAGVEVDGNDVIAVSRVAGEAVTRARSGGGATFIECKTCRTRSHAESMGDYTYRRREEVIEWRSRCPVQRFRAALLESGEAVPEEFDTIHQEVEHEVSRASEQAGRDPMPDARDAFTHVYAPPRTPPPEPAETGARELSLVAATLEALDPEMAANPRIFVLGEGIGARGGNFVTTVGLYAKYGAERLCDTPICERGFVGLAGGAAMTGTRPVVDFMFIDFINDAFGEIVNQLAKMQYMSGARLRMPVLLRHRHRQVCRHVSFRQLPHHLRADSRAARGCPIHTLRRQRVVYPRLAFQ